MNMSKKPDPAQANQWEHGWNEHEQMQLQRLASLPFSEKLVWLEEAHRLAIRLGALPSPCIHDPLISVKIRG
jgi:hypothetical protein